MNRFAVIVAGGRGQRFGSDIPKQFLLLHGKPVLMHSIEKFAAFCQLIVVVLPHDFLQEWERLCSKFNLRIPHVVTTGGESRSLSVYHGLSKIEQDGLVAIHDAARPLVSESLIQKVFLTAEEKGNAVPCIPINDSIRQLYQHENKAVDRNHFRLIQTPQCFPVSDLKNAFSRLKNTEFSDEATLMEQAGFTIHLTEGEPQNIKITGKFNLLEAEILFNQKDV